LHDAQPLLRKEHEKAEGDKKGRGIKEENRMAGARPLQPEIERDEFEGKDEAHGYARPESLILLQEAAIARQCEEAQHDRRTARAKRRLNERRDFRQSYFHRDLVDAEAEAKHQHQKRGAAVQRAKRKSHGSYFCGM
jgi:hypothetical protein